MQAGPEGDKRWTAIMSMDMAGYTSLSNDLGAERSYGLLSRVLGLAREVIEAEGGHVVDTAGDGILAAFGAPTALENAPLHSCRAAILFRDRLAAILPDLERDYQTRPAFRIGIGGGMTMVARLDAGTIKVVGAPVNKAARLQGLAQPGEIIISETIRSEAEGAVATSNRGSVEIKGFDEPVRIHVLKDLLEARSRFEGTKRRGLTALVSRQAEIARVLDDLGRDRPGAVIVSGAPGIGKSRLLHEVSVRLGATRPVFVGQCAQNAGSRAYGPVFEILRQAGQAPWGADRAKIFGALFERHPTLEDRDAVAKVLAVATERRDQAEQASATRNYILTLLRKLVTLEKAVLVIEDAHWIDSGSNALLSDLIETPIPLLVSSRPGFRPDWFQCERARHIALSPLSGTDIAQVAEESIGKPLSRRLSDLIVDKSEGVPLMAEEIARALRQTDRLADTAEGLDLVERDGSLLTGNLEQMVLARVDALPKKYKSVLQLASVIGRDFPETLLTDVVGALPDLPLIAKYPGLIEPLGDGLWRFAHALIRDAIYASLLTDQRQTSHLRIAEAMERRQDRAENWGTLADHFMQTRSPERATPYLIHAAGQSLAAYALRDVDERLETAMRFIETDPDLVDVERLRDHGVFWLRALHQIGDFGRLRSVSSRVLPRVEQAGYAPAVAIMRTMTAISMAHSRDYAGARDLGRATLELAEAEGDEWGAAWAKVALMRVYDETKWQGLDTIETLCSQITPVAERTEDNHLAMSALYLLSSANRSAGNVSQAVAICEEIEGFAKRQNDHRAGVYAKWARALLYTVQNDIEQAYAVIRGAHKESIPGGADERVAIGIEYFCRVFLEPPETLRAPLGNLMAEATALQDFNIAHSIEFTLAMLELRAGNLSTGWRALSEFIRNAEAGANLNLVVQGYIARAETLLAISGLVDHASEAPGDRPAPPRKRPGPADLVMFAALRPTARRRANAALDACDALPSHPHAARVAINRGILAAASGDKAEARRLLEAGARIAHTSALHVLVSRAEKALASL